jgi:hypothetical protein
LRTGLPALPVWRPVTRNVRSAERLGAQALSRRSRLRRSHSATQASRRFDGDLSASRRYGTRYSEKPASQLWDRNFPAMECAVRDKFGGATGTGVQAPPMFENWHHGPKSDGLKRETLVGARPTMIQAMDGPSWSKSCKRAGTASSGCPPDPAISFLGRSRHRHYGARDRNGVRSITPSSGQQTAIDNFVNNLITLCG